MNQHVGFRREFNDRRAFSENNPSVESSRISDRIDAFSMDNSYRKNINFNANNKVSINGQKSFMIKRKNSETLDSDKSSLLSYNNCNYIKPPSINKKRSHSEHRNSPRKMLRDSESNRDNFFSISPGKIPPLTGTGGSNFGNQHQLKMLNNEMKMDF